MATEVAGMELLESEQASLLPRRYETARPMRAWGGVHAFNQNWASVSQGNWSQQQMGVCVMNCVQNTTQVNFTIIIQV